MRIITKIGAVGLVSALAVGLTTPVVGADPATPERRATAHKVTLKANKPQVEAGARLVLAGQVKRAGKGVKVVISKKVGAKKWRAEATVTTNRKGRFTYVDEPRTPGARKYRAAVPKIGGLKAGKSKVVKVTVLQWHDLAQTQLRRADGVFSGVAASIKGKRFPSSVVSQARAASGSADWNLPAGCTTLRVRLGAGDDGDEGAVAHLALTGDGAPLFDGSFELTQSQARTFDVSDVFRLAFTWSSTVGTSTEPTAGAQAVLATPRLLCAF